MEEHGWETKSPLWRSDCLCDGFIWFSCSDLIRDCWTWFDLMWYSVYSQRRVSKRRKSEDREKAGSTLLKNFKVLSKFSKVLECYYECREGLGFVDLMWVLILYLIIVLFTSAFDWGFRFCWFDVSFGFGFDYCVIYLWFGLGFIVNLLELFYTNS